MRFVSKTDFSLAFPGICRKNCFESIYADFQDNAVSCPAKCAF